MHSITDAVICDFKISLVGYDKACHQSIRITLCPEMSLEHTVTLHKESVIYTEIGTPVVLAHQEDI